MGIQIFVSTWSGPLEYVRPIVALHDKTFYLRSQKKHRALHWLTPKRDTINDLAFEFGNRTEHAPARQPV
jgi:hypothetical protein